MKRFLPLVIVLAIWAGYTAWDRVAAERRANEEYRLALATAKVWIATAIYRDQPERFLAYRDSLLEASGVPAAEVVAWVKNQEDQPEELLPFAKKVQQLVDSLYVIEDSLAREAMIQAQDSARAAKNNDQAPEPKAVKLR